MMLHDDIAAALPELRANAESMMVDTCLIERRRLDENGEPVREMDPVTLELTDVWDEVWSGPCRVQRPSTTSDKFANAGEFQFGVDSILAQLPLGATGITRRDRVEVTGIGALTDPDLLGLVVWVRANLTKTHPTKRTLICEGVAQ